MLIVILESHSIDLFDRKVKTVQISRSLHEFLRKSSSLSMIIVCYINLVSISYLPWSTYSFEKVWNEEGHDNCLLEQLLRVSQISDVVPEIYEHCRLNMSFECERNAKYVNVNVYVNVTDTILWQGHQDRVM